MAVTPEFMTGSAQACIRALRRLEQTAIMLETYAPEIFPEVNERGQIHFGRAMMEAAAGTIRHAWKAAIGEAEKIGLSTDQHDLVKRLRDEAAASEELDPTDSSIAVMREAAAFIEAGATKRESA